MRNKKKIDIEITATKNVIGEDSDIYVVVKQLKLFLLLFCVE